MRSKGSDADNREKRDLGNEKRAEADTREGCICILVSLASSSCECIFTRTKIRVSRVSDSFLLHLNHAILGGAGASIDKIYDLRRKREKEKRREIQQESERGNKNEESGCLYGKQKRATANPRQSTQQKKELLFMLMIMMVPRGEKSCQS